jgi:hypothetical protein
MGGMLQREAIGVNNMVYYADDTSNDSGVRVGWLDKSVPFKTGTTDPVFRQKLLSLYSNRANKTRGFHLCPFCNEPSFGIPLEIEGQQIKMGSAEIHVTDVRGRTFMAPDLIYHYIVAHEYLPPRDFVEAVCSVS